MNRSALFVTVHKGASTFVADELADSMVRCGAYERIHNVGNGLIEGKRYDDLALPPTGVVAVRVYPQDVASLIEAPEPSSGRFEEKRLVLLMRDPRDVAVSLYYSKAFSHSLQVRDPARLLSEREELQEMGVYEGVLSRTARPAIREFQMMQVMAETHADALATTYEELLAAPETWIDQVTTHLGLSATQTARIQKRCAGSFKIPKQIDPTRHKRRMTPGNWREVFDDTLREHFETLAGPAMASRGYSW